MEMPEINLTLQKLIEAQAIVRNGHYVYASGRHGSAFINKDALFADPKAASQIAWQIAVEVPDNIEVIAGAAVGGAILSQLVAFHYSLNRHRPVTAVFADKTGDGQHLVLKRGYDRLVRDKRVLLVEDVVTTAGSLERLFRAVDVAGGYVPQALAIVDRRQYDYPNIVFPHGREPDEQMALSFRALCRIELQSWPAKGCPLCAQGVPINTDIGHGEAFLYGQNR
jgi:orotate phosphoribosyltransferase